MKNWLCFVTILMLCFQGLLGEATNFQQAQQQMLRFGGAFKEVVVVSLGSHCEVANIFRTLGSRYFSTPVDWLLSLDHKGLISLIDDKFKYLFDEKFLSYYPAGYVINSYYNIDFRHDWPDSDLHKHLPSIKEKYERRIERFFNLQELSNRVFFVRSAFDSNLNVLNNMPFYTPSCCIVTAAQAQELYDVLERNFPHIKFILVVINYDEEGVTPFLGLKNVIEFKVGKLHKEEDYRKFTPLLADLAFFDQIYTSTIKNLCKN